ncbi:MAG TPA: hypothetical protein VFM18_22025 [Methanosarcina sp.]|nr:hypothetical protein [Methanosarcina sp.]
MELSYKGYLIKPHKQSPSSYCIATAGQGGKIPAVLEGTFTSTGIAKQFIDEYLINKEVKNGKTSNQS